MAKIICLNKEYCGLSAGVDFVNGVGETANPHLIDWFKAKGYKVAALTLEEMTAEELIAYAGEHGIDVGQSTSQRGLLKKIQDAAKEPEGAKE